MNIVVYCSSRFGNDPKYNETASELGNLIGKNGHTLVFGGSKAGTMDTLCRCVMEAGGKTIGVVPDIAFIKQKCNPMLSERIDAKDVSERKNIMIELGDAFIALPGGFGTYDEVFSTIEQHFLEGSVVPIVLINTDGYYSSLRDAIDHMYKEGMCSIEQKNLICFADNAFEAMEIIEGKKQHAC